MSDRALSSVLRGMAVLAILVVVASSAVFVWVGGSVTEGVGAVFASVAFGVVVWVVAPKEQRNAVIWVLAVGVISLSAFTISQAVIARRWPECAGLTEWGETVPADYPAGYSIATGVGNGVASLGFFGMLTFGLLLFPDGRLLSRRWRWLAYPAGVLMIALGGLQIYEWRPSNTEPSGTSPFAFIPFLVLLSALLSMLSLTLRYRRADQQTRAQIKWVVWGGSAFVVLSMVGIMTASYATDVGFVVLAAAYGLAITKYRLYDLNVVISRTFVYVSLAAFIGAVYVGIVVGVSALFGSGEEPNVWLGIGATVVIAILFQPLRRQLERVANRMVFGRRSTPYEVLSSFSQNVAAVDPHVLEQVARSLTEGTTATEASILVTRGEELHQIASWPEHVVADGIEDDVTHEGEQMGVIRLTVPTGQAFTPTDEKLLDQVASGLGLALRNLQLTDDLRARVDQLRESRRRIVSVQDQTRRKLERDLHDGAQQRLVALKIKIGIGESMAQAAGLDDVADVLTTVKGEADMTIDSLRTLARGIYPPLLEAEGLGPALTTQLHRQSIPVTVQAAGVGRHPREIESTVYFCVLEAVQNSIRHAQAQSVLVTVAETNGDLGFEVRDDGIGFDPDKVTKGPGLINLTDRLDALEGTLEIESVPGHGTTIRGSIPVRNMEQV